MRTLLVGLVLLFSVSCTVKHTAESFRAPRAKPVQDAWVELLPGMELRIENAYYREGTTRRGLANFLGTAIARFQVRPKGGLRLLSVQSSVNRRPADEPPVQQLIPTSQRRYLHYGFFFAVVFRQKGGTQGSVLLGAGSTDELDRLATQLLRDPESICGGKSIHCTVFPETCTVSLDLEVVVNGAPRTVLWGSSVASVAPRARQIELLRSDGGRPTQLQIDPNNPNALRLALKPGDRINWE